MHWSEGPPSCMMDRSAPQSPAGRNVPTAGLVGGSRYPPYIWVNWEFSVENSRLNSQLKSHRNSRLKSQLNTQREIQTEIPTEFSPEFPTEIQIEFPTVFPTEESQGGDKAHQSWKYDCFWHIPPQPEEELSPRNPLELSGNVPENPSCILQQDVNGVDNKINFLFVKARF